MKKADWANIPVGSGASYPEPHKAQITGRETQVLTGLFGLAQFGLNRVVLAPGSWSTQRHWHRRNDEAVVVVSGEVTLVTDDGEEVLKAGDFVAFRMGDQNAHHLQNRGTEPAVYFDIGGRDPWDVSVFPDIGLEARTRMELEFRPMRQPK